MNRLKKKTSIKLLDTRGFMPIAGRSFMCVPVLRRREGGRGGGAVRNVTFCVVRSTWNNLPPSPLSPLTSRMITFAES